VKLTGGEIIVKRLVAEGVPYITGIPGHGVLGLFDAIRKEEAGILSAFTKTAGKRRRQNCRLIQ